MVRTKGLIFILSITFLRVPKVILQKASSHHLFPIVQFLVAKNTIYCVSCHNEVLYLVFFSWIIFKKN